MNNAELKSLYIDLKNGAKTVYEKQCLMLIEAINDQKYKLWSENCDLIDKNRAMEERIIALINKESDE